MKKLTKEFLQQPTIEIAKQLLGAYLIHETKDGKIIGKIVETEAYLKDDPASHSFRGKTKRNAIMFDSPGKAYVYFTYGMYHCFNIVTNKKDIGEAVLIRAIEPIEGLEIIKKNRKKDSNLCNGPARLTMAFNITKEHNGTDLINGNLRIMLPKKPENFEIIQTTRIGITQGSNFKYRFYIKNNPHVSKQ